MKKILTIVLGALIALLCFTDPATAQNDEGQITIKITKEIDGERKTFEGKYSSREEMESDPAYKEFVGDDNNFIFRFGGNDDAFIEIEEFMDQNGHFYMFSDGKDDDSDIRMFHPHTSDEFQKNLKKHMDRIQDKINDLDLESLDKQLRKDLEELLDEMEDSRKSMAFSITKRVKVSDVENDEFGEQGIVKDSELLRLNDLSFYPNPSQGKINIRFRTPGQGPLQISVFDLDGKKVYSTQFDSFSGFYKDQIDLTNRDEGIYLLEIQFDKKRLTKKIVIN